MTAIDSRLTERQFQALVQRLDELVQELEALPFPAIRELLFELLRTVDRLHREGLGRLVSALVADGYDLASSPVAGDLIVRTLLMLYDLADDAPEPPTPSLSNFIPLTQINHSRPNAQRRPVYQEVSRLDALAAGTMQGHEVNGIAVLLANVAGEVYAVRDRCPGSMVPLSLGSFTPPVVVCPWHNEAFDVRTGKRADGAAGAGLEVLPVAVRDGMILLAVETAGGGR